MPLEEHFEIRISPGRLLIALLVVLIPICLAGLYGISRTDQALESTIGGNYKAIAETAAGALSQFLSDRVVQAGQIAASPEVIQTAAAANRAYQGMSEDAIGAKIAGIDKQWNSPAAESTVRQIISSPAAHVLRRFRDADPRFLRMTLTDARGATVAATRKTVDYYQADEEYWQNIYASGRGAVSVTDVLFDDASKTYYIGVGLPVYEEGSTNLIGTLDALVDVSSVFPIVNRVQLGRSARTLLVREDGMIVAGPQVSRVMKAKSNEFEAVTEALSANPARRSGYLVSDVRGSGRTLIGYADAALGGEQPKGQWMVLVCQDASEAFAPVRFVDRLIAFLSLLGLGLVTLLTVYFMLHREMRITDIAQPKQPAAVGART
jgi:cache domain-containing protein